MLGKVRIVCDRDQETTTVSNTFIDTFMSGANEAQLKTYLYLLRTMQAGLSTTVSDIADATGLTEREVNRALACWEERGLVRPEYDGKKRLVQISLEDPSSSSGQHPPVLREETREADTPPARRRFSNAEVARFQADEALSMTLFAAETYFKRPLNPTEIQTILYVYEDLGFPADLVDYLLQYTAENAKGRLSSYMEKTAIAWHREGIRTLTQAQEARRDNHVYEIMRALGLAGQPTSFETGYFRKWLEEFAFPMDIVIEACRRTVFQTQKNRVRYADGILKSWHEKGVRTQEDITRLDNAHEAVVRRDSRKKQPAASAGAHTDSKNRFNIGIQPQEYDFDALRKKVVSNQ